MTELFATGWTPLSAIRTARNGKHPACFAIIAFLAVGLFGLAPTHANATPRATTVHAVALHNGPDFTTSLNERVNCIPNQSSYGWITLFHIQDAKRKTVKMHGKILTMSNWNTLKTVTMHPKSNNWKHGVSYTAKLKHHLARGTQTIKFTMVVDRYSVSHRVVIKPCSAGSL